MEVKHRISERGQSTAFFALVLPLMSIFILGILDYMVTTARMMEAVAVTDLSAHAGAQEIKVQPDGMLIPSDEAVGVARSYFSDQAPRYIKLSSAWCGELSGRPACVLSASVESAGILLPRQHIKVTAVGYLVYGATRGDQ